MTHKLRSQALMALLTFMLIIGLLPATAMAADTATVEINGQKLQNGVEVKCGEGTAVLDEVKGTLTLNNATINQEGTGPVVRVYNGELKVILIGENTVTSTNQRPFYTDSANIIIQGTEEDSLTIQTDSDGLQVDNGNLTIDGCRIDITSTSWGGMMCYGILSIQNGANIIINSLENTLIGNDGLFITDSTVNATSNANYSTSAIHSKANMSITNSMVTATSNGDKANAIYNVGDISIENSELVAITKSMNANPAICADSSINIINHSNVRVDSSGSIGIWSIGGGVTINNSIGYIRANDKWDAIRGQVDGATIQGSWVETFGSKISPAFTSTDSVIFLNNTGEANGSLTLPGNVTVGADMQLSIPDGVSISVPSGVTFTNHGQIKLFGDLTNDGGKIICDSHVGGTATCISKAVCDICGMEYDDFGTHNIIKTDAKEATCTEKGYSGDKVCTVCGNVVEEGKILPKLAHSFRNGKCTVCGAEDPNYNQKGSDIGDSASPRTGDSGNMQIWIALLLISGAGIISFAVYGRKRKYRR